MNLLMKWIIVDIIIFLFSYLIEKRENTAEVPFIATSVTWLKALSFLALPVLLILELFIYF